MIELFSRAPEAITVPDDQHIVPIPPEQDASSLSAILMDEDCHNRRERRERGSDSANPEAGRDPVSPQRSCRRGSTVTRACHWARPGQPSAR